MIKNITKDMIINEKDLLKFSYEDNLGIYYDLIKNNKIEKRSIILETTFEYFSVNIDCDKNINLICQDKLGNIVLCKLVNNKWTYRRIFNINKKYITSIKIKYFLYENNYIFILDSNPQNIYNSYNSNKINILYSDKNNIDIDFDILTEEEYSILIINSTSFNIDKIFIKIFYKYKTELYKDQIIYVSNNKYIDKSYLLNNNKVHFLILINEGKVKSVIYKNIDINKNIFHKEIILFKNKEISSCVITTINNVLWAVWISENKIYASYSFNLGEDFSDPKIYKYLYNENIKKIGILENNNIKETYYYEENENIYLFLEDILKLNKFNFTIEHKSIDYNLEKTKLDSKNKNLLKDVNYIINES